MTTLNSINKKLKEYHFDLKLVELKLKGHKDKTKIFCLEGDATQYDEIGNEGIFEVKSLADLDIDDVLDKAEKIIEYHERYLELNESASLNAQVDFTSNLIQKYAKKHTNRFEQLDYLEEVVMGNKIIESLNELEELKKTVEKQKKKLKKMSAQLKELQTKKNNHQN